MIKIYPLSLLLLLSSSFSMIYGKSSAGSQLWYSGFDAGISAQGFGGVASKSSGFHSLINPASSAHLESIRIFGSGNITLPEWGGSFGITAPIMPGGTLYAATQYLSFTDTSLTHIGYGKKVRSDLAFGLEGMIAIHPEAQKQNIGGGFSLGFLWTPNDFAPINKGWGFADFSMGAKLKTVFYPTPATPLNPAPEMILQLGIEATFMDFEIAKWKFILDYAIGFVPLESYNSVHLQTWASLGTTWTFWNIWDISVGAILGNNGLGFGSDQLLPFTLGTALGYEWESFSLKASYSFAGHEFFETREYMHTIGLEIGIGSKVSTNMRAVLKAPAPEGASNYFSPNNDLVKDTLSLYPDILGEIPIDAWRLNIINENGSTVRSFEDKNTKLDTPYTAGDFFINYFTSNKPHNIPKEIVWDGKDNKRQDLPEGTYHAFLEIRYEENKKTVSFSNTIILDTTPAQATVTIDNKYVYLGDDPKAKLRVSQTLSDDPWKATLFDNSDQIVVAEWHWEEGKAPSQLDWQLKNPNRINVATGDYSYMLTSFDKAGNYQEIIVDDIIIETTARKPEISSDYLSFSPNGDSFLDTISIHPSYSALSGLKQSRLVVYGEDGQLIYQENHEMNSLPSVLGWDGKNNQGELVEDNNYIVLLEHYYADNKQINSPPLLIQIDTTPPDFSIKVSPDRFSPDNDGINDVLMIDFLAEDLHNISNWVISLKNEKEEILKVFEGTRDKETFFWAPQDNVKSAELINFSIVIKDQLGNTRETPFFQKRIDILVDTKEKGLIASDTKAFFKEGVGVIAGDVFPYLDEIWSYYQYNPQDKIKILTQAYYAEAQNSEYEAYKLGIIRSDSMKNYLINKGINKNNIETEVLVFDEKSPKKQELIRNAKIYIEKK